MDDWRKVADAPENTKLIVWMQGGLRFAKKDSLGNWRGMNGDHITTPIAWMPSPKKPPPEFFDG